MNELHILIVEDNPVSALSLENTLKEIGYKNITIDIGGENVYEILKLKKPDVALLDLNLKKSKVALAIGRLFNEKLVPFIFTTFSNNDPAYQEAKKIEHFTILPKPVNSSTLESTISSLQRCIIANASFDGVKEVPQNSTNKEIFIRTANKLMKIDIKSILAVEADGNYCTLYTSDKKLVIKLSLSKTREKLGNDKFIQIHRNYIIQTSKIDFVVLDSNKVVIGEYEFPIGGRYRADFMVHLNKL